MPVKLIVNPIAGGRLRQQQRSSRRLIGKIAGELSRMNINYELVVTEASGEAFSAASEAVKLGYPLVLVAGGNGTVNEAVNALAGSETTLGVLPLGIENILANELNIPSDIKLSVKLIKEGSSHVIDLGKSGGRYFAAVAGIGFDATLVSNLTTALKYRLGKLGFIITGLYIWLSYQPFVAEVIIDNKHWFSGHLWQILVSNSSIYVGKIKIYKYSSSCDGKLEVCIFKQPNRYKFLLDFLSSFWKHKFLTEDIKVIQCKQVRVVSGRPLALQLDGEFIGTTIEELNFEVAERAIKVIAGPAGR